MSHRILIAEDEPSIALSLQFVLESAGYVVHVEHDGLSALAACETFAPHLIILDIMLPGMNGYEVCRNVRQLPSGTGIRVLMLTAKGQPSEMEAGLNAGADLYMTKPFGIADLLARVKTLLTP